MATIEAKTSKERTSALPRLSKKERARRLEAHEHRLYAQFLKARSRYLNAYHKHKVFLGRFAKDIDTRNQHYKMARDAYLAAYADRHSEASVRARKASLEFKLIYLKRTWAAQYWLGKGIGTVAAPIWRLANRDMKTRFIAGGALTAAALVAAPFIKTYLAAKLTYGGVKIATALIAKQAVPEAMTYRKRYQKNPEALAKLKWNLGWISFFTSGFIAAETAYEILQIDGLDASTGFQEPTVDVSTHSAMEDAVAARRGTDMYLPTDIPSNRVFTDVISDPGTIASLKSPALGGMYDRLSHFEDGSYKLLNTFRNRELVARGLRHLPHLKVLEETYAWNRNNPRFDFQDLERAREYAREWNAQFEQARAEADAQEAASTPELIFQWATSKVERALPSLSDFIETPASLSEVPITEHITPDTFADSVSAIGKRVSQIDTVIDHYDRVIGHDQTYENLLSAREYYRGLLSSLQNYQSDFDRMSFGHEVLARRGTLGAEDVDDAYLYDSIRRIDFGHYESAWHSVQRAEHRIESVPDGGVFSQGKIWPLRYLVPFKDGAGSDLSAPMGHAVYSAMERLKTHGTFIHYVTEGAPLTVIHHDPCHIGGTCVDFTVPWTGRNIYNVFHDLGPVARELIIEGRDGSERENLLFMLKEYLTTEKGMSPEAADEWIRTNTHFKTIPWATGENFHFEPKGADRFENPVLD